jgi:hypothetical protein
MLTTNWISFSQHCSPDLVVAARDNLDQTSLRLKLGAIAQRLQETFAPPVGMRLHFGSLHRFTGSHQRHHSSGAGLAIAAQSKLEPTVVSC